MVVLPINLKKNMNKRIKTVKIICKTYMINIQVSSILREVRYW